MKNLKIFRFITVLIALTATIFTFTDHLTVLGGDGASPALFFTSWATWLCTAVCIWVFILTLKTSSEVFSYNNAIVPLFKNAADIMALATFIVANFVLPKKVWSGAYWADIPGIFKHFLLPILVLCDDFLLDAKNKYKIYHPFTGIVVPVAYWIIVVTRFVIARANFGGKIPENLQIKYYPYGFTNLDNGHSLKGLIIMLSGICVGLILFGFLFILADKKKQK